MSNKADNYIGFYVLYILWAGEALYIVQDFQ